MKKDYDSTRIYRNTKKRVRHRLMTHPHFAMSEISLILVLLLKTNKTLNDMAKVQIKSEKLTPFGGIFSIMEQFDALLA